jgi:hypothetical protein
MNRSSFTISLFVACVVLTGCVSAPQKATDDTKGEPQAVATSCTGTGSHIRRRDCRDSVDTLSRKDMENRVHDSLPQRPEPGIPTN